jgi:inner membrane protein
MARLLIMGILMLGLMIPLMMVEGVVAERATRRDAAVTEVGGVWGAAQTLGGPILTVPYRYTWIDNAGKAKPVVARAYFLPELLDIDGTVEPEIRRRSLFEVVVYKAHLKISGRFARPNVDQIRPVPDQILWDDAALSLGVSDPRGISRRATVMWNGREQAFAPGVADVGLFTAGVQAPAPGLSASSSAIPFSLDIDVNGSRLLRFLPAGNDTTVKLTSSWPHPSFGGAPLPESRQSDGRGFSAMWRTPYFGRGYPPQWTSVECNREQLKALADASAFGVALVQPVDIYQQAERAVKYAALFIVMTFVTAFLWEIVRGALLHPIQYLFVGFAMCIFYLLLLSLSEHIGFDKAYVSAATATVSLLAWYWSRGVGSARQGTLMGTALTGLYGFLYLLLRLEDYALLAGSIGLFAMLAGVMYLTRRVNWYDLRLGTADGSTAL